LSLHGLEIKTISVQSYLAILIFSWLPLPCK